MFSEQAVLLANCGDREGLLTRAEDDPDIIQLQTIELSHMLLTEAGFCTLVVEEEVTEELLAGVPATLVE